MLSDYVGFVLLLVIIGFAFFVVIPLWQKEEMATTCSQCGHKKARHIEGGMCVLCRCPQYIQRSVA